MRSISLLCAVFLGFTLASAQTSKPVSPFDQVMALPYHLFVTATQVPRMPLDRQYGTALVLLAIVLSAYGVATALRMRFSAKKLW